MNWTARYELQGLGLKTRAVNALVEDGVTSVADLATRYSRWHLVRIPNCGDKTTKHIIDTLKQHGISLPDRRA